MDKEKLIQPASWRSMMLLLLLLSSVLLPKAGTYTLLPPILTESNPDTGDFPIIDGSGKAVCIVYSENEIP